MIERNGERVVLIINSGECNLFAAVLSTAVAYCKEHHNGEAYIRNGLHGHEIFIPAIPPKSYTCSGEGDGI